MVGGREGEQGPGGRVRALSRQERCRREVNSGWESGAVKVAKRGTKETTPGTAEWRPGTTAAMVCRSRKLPRSGGLSSSLSILHCPIILESNYWKAMQIILMTTGASACNGQIMNQGINSINSVTAAWDLDLQTVFDGVFVV